MTEKISRRVLREPEVAALTGMSKSTRYRAEKQGEFPPRVRLSTNLIGWYSDEIERWLASRPRGLQQYQEGSR